MSPRGHFQRELYISELVSDEVRRRHPPSTERPLDDVASLDDRSSFESSDTELLRCEFRAGSTWPRRDALEPIMEHIMEQYGVNWSTRA